MLCQIRKKFWIICCICISAIVLFSPITTFADTFSASVLHDNVNVRSGPGLQHSSIMKLNKGEKYDVLKEQDGWYLLSLSNNKQGWVANWLMKKIEGTTVAGTSKNTSIGSIESTVDNLNVRSGDGISFSSIGKIHKGTSYPLIEEKNEWVKIQYSLKEQGWVAKWLVTIKKTEEQADDSDKEENASPDQVKKQSVKVTATTLFVRSGPGTSNASLGKLKLNDVVDVIETANDWLKIKYNEKDGWIAKEYTESIVTVDDEAETDSSSEVDVTPVTNNEPKPKVKLLNEGINLREGPGLQHKVITTGKKDETYEIIEQSGDWYKVALGNGGSAFVAGWVVSVVDAKVDNPTDSTTTTELPNALHGKIIVIDPGHGGKDSGAIGNYYKSYEKSLNLQVSKIIVSKLTSLGATVYMTRSADEYLTLQSRVDLAVAKRADAFISIHHNANFSKSINGTAIYYYSEGRAKDLAKIVQSEVVKRNGLNNMGARYGNLHVLRENPRLAILAELAFLTNKFDEEAAKSSVFQEQSAEGIVQGLNKYFNMQ